MEIVLAVVAVGIALAGPIAAQGASLRSEIRDIRTELGDISRELSELHREIVSILEQLVRLKVTIDIIQSGLQFPRL